MRVIKAWKKVLESDLTYVVNEAREEMAVPCVLILTGDVGVGKTTFVKCFSEGQKALSPTYSVINDMGNITHADFYRIKDEEEITHLELELYLENKSYFIVEWGIDYLQRLVKELGSEFNYYEMELMMSESGHSRNMVLRRYEPFE